MIAGIENPLKSRCQREVPGGIGDTHSQERHKNTKTAGGTQSDTDDQAEENFHETRPLVS
jgi:hypothetical protein